MTERTSGDRVTRQGIILEDFHIPLEKAFTVQLTDTLECAVEVMDRHNVDQLPVVDAICHGAMVVTRRVIGRFPLSAWGGVFVQDALEQHSNDLIQRVRATTSLADATDLLVKFDWLLTTDESDNPVGLATVGDALNAMYNHLLM